MDRKTAYLLLCVLGTALPYWQFLPWVLEHGLNVSLFVKELFANRIGGFFGMDVLVSAVTLAFFVFTEGRQRKVQALWLPIAAVVPRAFLSVFPYSSIYVNERWKEVAIGWLKHRAEMSFFEARLSRRTS